MNHVECDTEAIIKHKLEFSLLYPLYNTVPNYLRRLHNLHDFVGSLDKSESNKNLILSCLNECDYILHTLEEFDCDFD